MSEKSEILKHEDVLTITDMNIGFPVSQPTFRVSEAVAIMVGAFVKNADPRKRWTETGMNAEVLTGSQNWRKGKIRITVEFIPDDPAESEEKPTV